MPQLWTRNSVQRIAALALATAALPAFAQHYKQTNLTSDQSGASFTDSNLVNPWGLSRSSGSPWWISDNGTGRSTLYDGTGKAQSLVVTIPPADPSSNNSGTPTGTIFNGSTGFAVAPGSPAVFLFVTEDGTISGWNPKVNPTNAIIKVNTKGASVFKGATIATVKLEFTGPASFLYAADFRTGRVQVYDSNFNRATWLEWGFRDFSMPPGYAPFNIQNIGGNLYVSFAKQDSEKHDEVDGPGLGYVDVFSPTGQLLHRLQHGPWFNGPWGLVLASGDFGIYSHDVLVGQFGDGTIAVFDSITGDFKGHLRDSSNLIIKNPGLWGLSFGNGGSAGPANTLYFSAGSDEEQHGLFGSITAVENVQGNDQ